MASPADLGILVPALWSGRGYSARRLVPFFRAAEELGFGSLWTPDRLFHAQVATPHPLVTLSLAAGVTERVGLGAAVVITGVRNPIETAQLAASLDALSDGRLTLGVGLGGREHEYAALGVDARRRVSRFEEGIALMRRLWTEESVTFAGRHFALEGASILPRPGRAIPMPIGARAAPALARAGRIGDGWIQGGRGSTQEFREAWALVRESAEAAGRDPAALMSGKLLYVNPGRDARAAEAQVRRHTVAYYGREMGEAQTVAAGPPERVAEVVREFIDAGCQTPMLGLPEPDVDKLVALAQEVAPLV
ncbi:MAG: LLM class flavin-dependent oxidoreductase [Dehalococcoidia bacterium]|nr:LLM class flavin-dependent oxidoreductase [Dehalococcoidia bacterium]